MVCVLYANNALLVIDPCSAGSPANAVLITVSRYILQSGRIFVPVCDHICLKPKISHFNFWRHFFLINSNSLLQYTEMINAQIWNKINRLLSHLNCVAALTCEVRVNKCSFAKTRIVIGAGQCCDHFVVLDIIDMLLISSVKVFECLFVQTAVISSTACEPTHRHHDLICATD